MDIEAQRMKRFAYTDLILSTRTGASTPVLDASVVLIISGI